MSNIKWFKGKINSGDIISFTYDGRKRNVIVMECPNDSGRAGKFMDKTGKSKRFLHGLQIPFGDRKDALVENIIKKMGGTRVIFEKNGIQYFKVNFGIGVKDLMNARRAYDKVKNDVKENNMYKTYDWSKISSVSLTNRVADLEKLINPRYVIEENSENKK